MDNLTLYNKVRSVPATAVKPINGGRLKGMSDINPVWRIKALTEQFGPCGIGWKYIIKKCWTEQSPTNEVAAFVEIGLYIKYQGEWSEEIPGTGGSMFVANERNGAYTSDECYKMALTDALSVACKSLGVGADVYWNKDDSKYQEKQSTQPQEQSSQQAPRQQPQAMSSEQQQKAIYAIAKQKKVDIEILLKEKFSTDSTKNLTKQQASELINLLQSA